MKKKIEQLDLAKDLLGQALSVAYHSMPNNRTVSEARGHIRQAMKKIDLVQKKDERKRMTQDQFQNWWGNIQAGTSQLAESPMTQEAQQRSLAQLDDMIQAEKRKLQELEKNSVETEVDDQLLSD